MKIKKKAQKITTTVVKLNDDEALLLASILNTLDWESLGEENAEFAEDLYDGLDVDAWPIAGAVAV